MARLTRRQAVSVAVEASYGSSPGTFGPILLVGEPDFTIEPDVVPRDNLRGYFGASEELTGTRRGVLNFTTEIAGSSALGVAPKWGALLRGCGWAETITADTRVEYTPITDAHESLSIRHNRDGVQYLGRGGRGTGTLSLMAFERPTSTWAFRAFDTGASAVSIGSRDFAGWQRPVVVNTANSGSIKLGSSYSSGSISGGTAYPSRGMTLDLGNEVTDTLLIDGEAVEIADRKMSGTMTVELTAAEEVTWRDEINSNTLSSLSFSIGTAGNQVAIHMPNVQRINPQLVNYNGKVLLQVDLRILPTLSGNDECRIIIK